MSNIFVDLVKFKPTTKITPLENFSTELLKGLLEFSRANATTFFKKFLHLFHVSIDVEAYSNFEIDSQARFYTNQGKLIRPDLAIWDHAKTSLFLIEVKVEQSLNEYEIDSRKVIDQIELYELAQHDFENLKVMSLTKFHLLRERKENINVLWYEVYDILGRTKSNVETFLHESFKQLLGDYGMSISKISKVPDLRSLEGLIAQLGILLDRIPKFDKPKLIANPYYIAYKSSYGNQLELWFNDSKIITMSFYSEIEKKRIEKFHKDEYQEVDGYYYFEFPISSSFLGLSAIDQSNEIQVWIESII